MQITLKYGLTPHYNTIENNEIYNTHRGGIMLGGNYNVVQNNSIHDGTGLLDRKPLFPDSTRYGINQEDAYGDHSIIRNNLFYNVNHGILIGCWSAEIHNNLFYNLTGIAVNIYIMQSVHITQNQMYRCQTGIGLMTANLSTAVVYIENNILAYVTTQSLNGVGYEVWFERNTLIDVNTFFMQDDEKQICRGNRFFWTGNFSGIPFVTANRIESCIFIGLVAQREAYLRVYEHIGSVFSNIHARLETRNQTTKSESVMIRDCKFTNSILSNRVYLMKQRHVDIRLSKLTDSILKIGNINTPDQSATTTVTESEIVLTTSSYLILNESNSGHGWIEVNNSSIQINNAAFGYFVNNVYLSANTVSIFLKNNEITYTGATPLVLPNFYEQTKKTSIRVFVNARNQYLNMVLPSGEAGRYVDYDPAIEGLAPPSTGYWFKGDTYGNAAPVAGGYAGWICTTQGFASATPWRASTAVRIGDQINAGGRVYEARTSGTTGSTQPPWPNTSRGTVSDNGVTWQESGVLAQFRPYAPIS
ncbi:right-handed parallel beta-helix repeat-containing protein [Paenibacillus sp. SCIV0701]|uniref:Right-handed parallel beta-helix repeat-containing protein n=2 Tax=Paenibacillus soyae TaxID=2969249 RepID=A0A9X2MM00_9BACL|nr:right-handed parallel beta-helix repeat-containing protein [Paenibacillus soyae]